MSIQCQFCGVVAGYGREISHKLSCLVNTVQFDAVAYNSIVNGKRPEAEQAIQDANVATLMAAQQIHLSGDWRRAGVAKRLKQLQKICPKP